MQYRAERHASQLTVRAMANNAVFDCTLVNVSETGGRLAGMPELKVGDDVHLTSSIGVAAGVVKWVRNDECGIEFRPRVSRALVSALCKDAGLRNGTFFAPNGLREM